MIDATQNFANPAPTAAKPRPVFKMVEHDRMAGHIPVWAAPDTAQGTTLARLDAAASNRSFEDVLNDALAYSPAQQQADINDQPFGFGDVIDIINPLQHIPLVGTAYRSITGDTMRPSSDIVGGALFGGALGAAAGLVNLIIEEETGKNIEGHAMAAIFPAPGAQDESLTKLAEATPTGPALPATALGFAPLTGGAHQAAAEPARQVWKFNE